MEDNNKKVQTPEETALSEFAKKLEELDQTAGIFGEAVTDKDLEDVAGGVPLTPSQDRDRGRCSFCGITFDPDHPPKDHCLSGHPADCPYLGKTR